ncbi:hypothetical protein TRFO_36318 [Tritrichomonas foetus]|uniref:Myb-like DNA-binding domain containing protein n=1 Tax=Tritrichomonas foetus TaxID=1144522 RepID=A0A1J4JIV3_9EUKA|nr:hypothetical protein TRFO_36318 [Tritrichomonas foetus]|eukprot:OHS97491.1 hypothetical protein TRFO_36318 [Tritrichomonas foetus]
MTKHLGAPALLEVGTADIDQIDPPLRPEVRDRLIQSIACFLNNTITFDEAKKLFVNATGSSDIIDRLKEVIDLSDDPSQCFSDDPDIESSPVHKKSKPWSQNEDVRLLAGIYKYGLDNWSNVASFVGNGRTRSQASQRWSRGLNPRISKESWSAEEDQMLFRLVQQYGDRAWTKIATLIGNRSDVQCRYHYHQIARLGPIGAHPMMSNNNNSSFANMSNSLNSGMTGGFNNSLNSNIRGNFSGLPNLNGIHSLNSMNAISSIGLSHVTGIPTTQSGVSNHSSIASGIGNGIGSIGSGMNSLKGVNGFNHFTITMPQIPAQPRSHYPPNTQRLSVPEVQAPSSEKSQSAPMGEARFMIEQKIASELRNANQARLTSGISTGTNSSSPSSMGSIPMAKPQSQPITRMLFAGPQDIHHAAAPAAGQPVPLVTVLPSNDGQGQQPQQPDPISLDSFLQKFMQ